MPKTLAPPSPLPSSRWRAFAATSALVLSGGPLAASAAESALAVPMQAAGWTAEPGMPWVDDIAAQARFARYEGMPRGTMTLNDGVAVAKGVRFGSGTIDFDMKPLGYNDAGIIFHRKGASDGEFFYLRANPDCPAANDCIQYAPLTRTLMAWNLYAKYQAPAQISPTSWNHVRLVVAGGEMTVYLNRLPEPALVVPRLLGLFPDGGVAFKGPAVFANLVVRSTGNQDRQAPPAVASDPDAVTDWLVAPPTNFDRAHPVVAADMPPARSFGRIDVEPDGLVNLGRAFGTAHAPGLSVAWLRTEVTPANATRRTLRLGFAPQVWVFLNGREVYSGKNAYYPQEKRLSVDGRLDPDNVDIPLTLTRGRNELVIAVSNDWKPWSPDPRPTAYGWGLQAHLEGSAS